MSKQIKERPILFNAPMVRALLDGSKTQTRRVVKPMAAQGWLKEETLLRGPRAKPVTIKGEQWAQFAHPLAGQTVNGVKNDEWSPLTCIRCPYGQPGDRLWVRESYRFTDAFDIDSPARVAERCLDAGYSTPWAPIQYDADGARRDWRHTGTPPHHGEPQPGKSRPSIHMPRWASRILLEIVAVRVERLHDISEDDAKAEGAWPDSSTVGKVAEHFKCDILAVHPSLAYRMLWESINGAGNWVANPWVWVIEFKRVLP